MNKITISTGHPDAGRVYAEAYDAASAREEALREEVAGANRRLGVCINQIEEQQHRLTVAEQRAGELGELLSDCVNEFSTSEASQFELEMLNKMLAALKPAAEPHKCIECESQYCHGVCVERGDDDECYKGAEGEGS